MSGDYSVSRLTPILLSAWRDGIIELGMDAYNTFRHPIQTIKNSFNQTKEVILHPIQSVKNKVSEIKEFLTLDTESFIYEFGKIQAKIIVVSAFSNAVSSYTESSASVSKQAKQIEANETTSVSVVNNATGLVSIKNPINNLPHNNGYSSFGKLKKALGSAGDGKQWHHIVEQSQIKKSNFSPTQIHNTDNIIAIDAATHAKISGYYSTKSFRFTNGLSVRDWLVGKSFEEQYNFGLEVLKQYGVIE
ncbi:MAG: hypothetical protein PUC37_01945 [Spirochaetales bacterium]|nr:hypothetical protein [Spirochaetales bacterium]